MGIIKLTVIFVAALAGVSFGQGKSDYDSVHSEGFYFNIGVADGPDFADFFNYTNEFYQTRFQNTGEELDRFGKGVNVGLGYIVRLYPNFALDVGFSIYRLKSSGRIENLNTQSYPESYIDHELEYQVGLFSATIPVLLDFDPRQPAVPYVGIGISIFSMRLDDIRDDGSNPAEILRETNTSVGGHFETGLFVKISNRLWVDFKARWHSGSANLRALEPPPPADFGKYKLQQDISQITLGGIYYFR